MMNMRNLGYVVVDPQTKCKVAHPRTGKSLYSTTRSARAAATQISKLRGMNNLLVMFITEYEAQVPWVEVTNLMSGKLVKIRADDVGTCVDPSTETYWSM